MVYATADIVGCVVYVVVVVVYATAAPPTGTCVTIMNTTNIIRVLGGWTTPEIPNRVEARWGQIV